MSIILLVLSLVLNLLLFWYARKLLQKLSFFSEDIEDINEGLGQFAQHLESLHSQETYYGDQDLQNLIAHAQNLAQEMNEFKDLYLLGEGEIQKGTEEDATEE
tara:strand:- start:212 stop:520 length:309 start_codon:yes stop_codon:yes gene_type:complete